MNEEITVISTLEELTDRKAIVNMTMEVRGEKRAGSRIIAVGVKDNM